MSLDSEFDRLEKISNDSWYLRDVFRATTEYSATIFTRHLVPNAKILELGPAEGVMTEKLVEYINAWGGVNCCRG